MKKSIFFVIIVFVLPCLLSAQQTLVPGRFLPKATPKGIGKIDTRVDNMGYWRRMADSGFVYVAPVVTVPSAIFTGSRIESPLVMTADSQDVPVTSVNSTQSENSIFVEPDNDLKVLNSNNSTQNPVGSLYGADYLITSDGGSNWGGSINGAGGGNSGDPTTAISLTGRMYVGFINSSSGQSIAYSADGGTTWTPVVCGTYNGGLLDKNHMWIDNRSSSPYNGYVYSAWTDFGTTNTNQIMITRSSNLGLNYSTPLNVSSAVNAGSHNQGVNIQTGPNGEVYVIWAIYDSWPSDETAIGFNKSTNGGTSYGTGTRIISNIRGIRNTETSKNQRVNSFPSMAVDISGGSRNGNIYIVWTNIGVPGVNTGSDIDIYVIRSTNGGTSWSTPVKVNQDPGGLGKQHYFPWITCDPVSGDLSVIFYDDRNVSSSQCETFCANSYDGGTTWEDFKVSDVAFTPSPIPGLAGGYMGDYLGISARSSKVYPVWCDNRTGTVMTYCSPYDLSPLPNAAFTAATTKPCLNQTDIITDQTNKSPISWIWTITPSTFNYVDGTSAISQNPHVQFTAYGNYNVQLIVANTAGSDTLLKANYISVNYANADFTANITKPVINYPVIFTDQSSCNISSYSWNFGADATPATATTQGPHSVTYSSTGLKTVSLTVNGNVTTTKTNYIDVQPETFNMTNGTVTTCSGIFYDSGGSAGNYQNDENYTETFYPADTSKNVQMVFTLFDTESGYDFLYIYDGPSTSSALIGTYNGTTSPGTIVSTHSSGALTFMFTSDVSVTGQGWAAGISCVNAPPPVYCSAGSTYTNCDEYISLVQIGSINNSTSCSSPGGYGNYTSLSTKVSPAYNYSITITNGKPYSGDQCGIWIDWNQNSNFSDADETITVTGTPGLGPYTATITPPANAVKGTTRMRVRITYTGAVSPCGNTIYGEVEDYNIYVGTPGLWAGGMSGSETDWNTPGNWDDGIVPASTTNVIIPAGLVYYPIVSGTFSCLNMQVKDGGTLTVQAGATLNVTGTLDVGQGVSGVMVVDGGICNVTGIVTAHPGSIIDVRNGGSMTDY